MPNFSYEAPEPFIESQGAPKESTSERPPNTLAQNQIDSLPDIHFSPIKTQKEEKENRLSNIIQGALNNDRVDLYLQPIVSLPSRDVAYYESFTRLKDRR